MTSSLREPRSAVCLAVRLTVRLTACFAVAGAVIAGCQPERTAEPGSQPLTVAKSAPAEESGATALEADADGHTAAGGARPRADADGTASAAGQPATHAATAAIAAGEGADGDAPASLALVGGDWGSLRGPVAAAMERLTATLTAEPSESGSDAATGSAEERLAAADELRDIGRLEEAEKAYRALLGEPGPVSAQAAAALARAALDDDDPATAVALLVFAAPSGMEELTPAGLYHYGTAAEQLGDYPAAYDAYVLFAEAAPELSDVAHLAAGTALLDAGDAGGAIPLLQGALDAAGDDSTAYLAALRLGNAQLRAGRAEAALAAYAYALGLATNDPDRAQALAGQIAAHLAAGDQAAAVDARRRLVHEYPATVLGPAALLRLDEAVEPVPAADRAAVLLGAGDYAAALDAYDQALAEEVDPPFALRLARLEALRAAGDHAGVVSAADEMLAASPDDPSAADAAWLRALSLQASGDTTAAADSFAALSLLWPDRGLAADALDRRAGLLEDLGGAAAAADAYDALATRYPDDDRAADASFRSAFLRWRAGDDVAAEARLARLAETETGGQRARALYWLGRLALDRGDVGSATARWQEAVAEDPHAYYGLRAAERLGLTGAPAGGLPAVGTDAAMASWLAEWVPGFTAEEWQVRRAAVAADRDVARARAWLDIGERRAAVRTMDKSVRHWAGDDAGLAALAYEARDLGLVAQSIAAARQVLGDAPQAQRETAPTELLRLVYPDAFGALIREVAERNGVPPALMFALIRTESRFEPSARSVAGAAGLTQVMPSTGATIAAQLGEEGYEQSNLLRPETSIRFGVWFLRGQLESHDGIERLALAAYNGGPGNASRWWSDAGGDLDAFVEVIDYDETRNYVTWVEESRAWYEQLYGE